MEARCQREHLTNVEGNLRNRFLSKAVLYSVKVFPILISGIYVLNTILSYCGIDWEGFSYIVQFLFIGFMYCASLRFKFCIYHRVFIHYILLTLILNIIDYHWGIPLSDRNLFLMYMIITGITLFVALYFHQKYRKCKKEKLVLKEKGEGRLTLPSPTSSLTELL